MARSYNRYRIRKGFNGVCVLQQLISFPSLIGGQIDSTTRSWEWRDVPFKNAPTEFEIVPYSRELKEELRNKID